MVSLGMKMDQELVGGTPQRSFTEEDDSFQGFLFQRSEKPFQMGVAIGTLGRQPDWPDAGYRQDCTKLVGELGIAVHQYTYLTRSRKGSSTIWIKLRAICLIQGPSGLVV